MVCTRTERSRSCSTGCAAKHAEACRTPHTHTPFLQPVAWNQRTLPLSIVTLRWYCFTFSWEGMCTVWAHASEAMRYVRVHAIPEQWFTSGEECVDSLPASTFVSCHQYGWGGENNAKYLPDSQPLRIWPQNIVSLKKKRRRKTSIFSCVLASVGVCLHAEDLFDSSDSPGLTWNTFRVKHSFHIPRLFLFIYFTGIWKSGKWSSFVWF